MMYYAVAVTLTLILCYYNTTVYPLPNGLEARGFRSGKCAFLVLLPLTFVAVFRWNVGVDSLYQSSYWQAYHAAAEGQNLRDFELGFYWFTFLLAKLRLPFFWYLFLHGVLFMLLCSHAIAKGSIWARWSILVFFLLSFYFDSYSSLRQSLAQAIALIGWANMGYYPPTNRNDIRNLLIFLAASLFHYIALINLPIYFLCRVRFSKAGMLKILIGMIILSPVIQILLRFFGSVLASEYSTIGVARLNMLMSGILALICWYFYDEISAVDENAYKYVNLALFIFVLIMNSGAMPMPYRVFDMLKIGYVFIIPYLLRGIRSNRIRLYMEIGILMIFGAWFVNYFFIQDRSVSRYQSAFSDWATVIHLP